MKNFNKIEGITPLSENDMKNIDGGILDILLGCAIGGTIALGFYLLSEFDSIKEGAEDAMAGNEYDYCPCCPD